MTTRLAKHELVARNEIVAPPTPRACTDRNFNLPVALHAAYFGFFFAFLAVMWASFASPGLVVPMGVFVAFLAAFYVVPMKWATMQPDNESRAMAFSRLMADGVDTITGRCSGGAVIAQVLILPALVFAWGIAIALIVALV
jgi:hypothetical protein